MNITRKWIPFLAVGCSHGEMIDPVAERGVMQFKERFKPKRIIHLGDFLDTTCFRSGARGTADQGEEIEPDFNAGLSFLEKLSVTDALMGNHEARLWRMCSDPDAKVRWCALQLINRIREQCKKQKTRLVEYFPDGELFGYIPIGNYKLMHGYIFNENACRDHAEAHGNVIHAHTHRPSVAKGRRDDNPTGLCTGTLTRIGNMDYAKGKRSTLSWGQGFIWGYYTDSQTVCWLFEQPKGMIEWKLPI